MYLIPRFFSETSAHVMQVAHSDGGMPYAKLLGGVAGFGGDQLQADFAENV